MAWPNDVTRKDLRIEFCRGSGKGGQNRNKRDTACRITHIPTGLSSRAEDERSQSHNKKKAFERLARQLVPLMLHKEEVKRSTDNVRTYNQVRGTVKDKRVPDKTWEYDQILEGRLDKMIQEVLTNSPDKV